ncbi:RRP15-like protein isoform X1 [Sinocyclocheilus rhinocerous]|uniref:RRP15-like protein n=1 Tax=Sinocyclocheilus rhinocerous TaxID=307959 RepID=A0A673KTM5_9TELE|nr:PREDICTED: RRP15-like protein isoform X1 [Sinocyclocheilus rhinocerous]
MATLLKKPHVVVEEGNEEECGVSDDSVSNDGESGPGSDQEGSGVGSDVEDSGDEDGKSEEGQNGDGVENPNVGWAEAMAKILGKKTPDSKPSILLKNKELDKIKEKEKKERLKKKKQIDKKRAWENMCREKPDVVRDREHERNLQKIATRGVVQLFNAVKKHQKNVDERIKEVGGSERKKSRILSSVTKKDFIDVLRGADVAHKPAIKKEKVQPVEVKGENPSWSVLRDDFMMGTSMKDWDKESDEEREGEEEGGEDNLESDEDCSSESD